MGSQQCSELMHANDGMGVSCKDCSTSLGPDLARKKAVRFFQSRGFCQGSLFEYIILRMSRNGNLNSVEGTIPSKRQDVRDERQAIEVS